MINMLDQSNFHVQIMKRSFDIPEYCTRSVQWETGKVVLKIACTTDVIVCMVCEGVDLELPIHGVGTPAACIGTWEIVRKDGGALASVH
jgi:hypothetical protein